MRPRRPHHTTPVRPVQTRAGRTVAAVAVLATGLVLVGCGSVTVNVAPPRPTDSATMQTCRDLQAALPPSLRGLHRARTAPDSPYTSAWSDSDGAVVTVRCGVGHADEATADIVNVNDVDWSPVQRDNGTSFYTVGRQVIVEVDVPSELGPEASYLVDLTDAVTGSVPLLQS